MFFKRGVGQFARNRRANVAVIFALCLTPMLLAVGFAIDYKRQQLRQLKVQTALDAAGLAAAKHVRDNLTASTAEVQTIAQNMFNATIDDVPDIDMETVQVTRSGDELSLSVEGEMPTTLMHLGGHETMPLDTTTEIAYGAPSKIEIALVLDTSESMDQLEPGGGTRLEALQSAASNMVNTLIDPDSEKVRMSIVPFSTHINVGTGNRHASWIQVEPNRNVHKYSCRVENWWLERNCSWEEKFVMRDGVKHKTRQRNCDGVDKSKAPKKCTSKQYREKWYGCVRSRKSPRDLNDMGYMTGHKIKGFVSRNDKACAPAIREMTNEKDDLLATINDLKAREQTYIPAGIMWGYRSLSSRKPFARSESDTDFADTGGTRALVLMSDGKNTRSPRWTGVARLRGKHLNNDEDKANANTEDACDFVKREGVEVSTIAFGVNDVDTKKMLEECASGTNNYYVATNAAQLEEVFVAIRDKLERDIAVAG